ncbi:MULTISPECIES: hypothetical protein [unclassified Ensifer]|uniref:hypothetical protein n=1 Tax=unclassified Ensifer TaxID=2633371 RepID=UPI0004B28530|nr:MULTISPECIES: hypothetical protein [unclassified Ensifer]MBD9489413.1 hypothetical protein [Ensifer sp. ENS11]MDP9632754.1 hypothetical protein [Ensifer adhaerens]
MFWPPLDWTNLYRDLDWKHGWISPIKPASFSGGGGALGAALLPFLDALLPPPVAG